MGRHMVLAGRYELMSPLGRGGMGQVWEGTDRRLDRRVAVKLLTNEVLAGRAEPHDLARRFAREAAVTAGLRHPGVPAVYDAGTYDGGLFLVMEMVGGCALGDLMAEQGPLPVAWATGIAAQVAAVLTAAHERRLVHRDVKPQNVMLTGDGTVKVLDFGVAAVLDQAGVPRITRTGETIGTPAYMAPEQLHSRPATPRTDLYALGCVLYEMLSGEPIFDADSPAGLMHQHLEQAPAPLRRADVGPELDALVRQLLEKDPARRPADAREVYDRLLPQVTRLDPLGELDPAGDRHNGMQLYSRVLVRLSGAPEPRTEPATAGAGAPTWAPPWPDPQPATGSGTGSGYGYGRNRYDAPGGPYPPDGPYSPGGPYPPDGPYSPDGRNSPGDQYPPGASHPSDGPAQATAGLEPRPSPSARHGTRWKLVHSLWILPTLAFGLGTWLSFGYIAARHRKLSWLFTALAYLVIAVTAFALIGSGPEQLESEPSPIRTDIGMVIGLIAWPAGLMHALWVNLTVRLPLLEHPEQAPWIAPPPVSATAPFPDSHSFR